MKSAFISFGPTCVPAEILKAGSLRRCTFGFDWFRSGSFFVGRFLESSLDDFLKCYVFNPCIPLAQLGDPASNPLSTTELSHHDVVFGFPYLYNPHRSLNCMLTRDYYRRSFARLKNVLQLSNVFKIIFIADYINKPHASYIKDPMKAIAEVNGYLSRAGIKNYSIVLLRIEINFYANSGNFLHKRSLIGNISTINQPGNRHPAKLVYAHIPDYLEQSENKNNTYRLLAKELFHFGVDQNDLWSPSSSHKQDLFAGNSGIQHIIQQN